MELINRERLIETICGTVSEVAMTAPYDAVWFTRMARRQLEIIEIIKKMPAIQTQLEYEGKVLVRCKECKHWNEEKGRCDKHSYFYNDGMYWDIFNEDDFCSYGERKDNG